MSMGFPKQEYWSGLPLPSLCDLSNPGIKPRSPTLAGRFFSTEPLINLSSHVQPEISHPGRAMGSYDWIYMVIGSDTAAHMIVNFFQNYMTEAGERQPQG